MLLLTADSELTEKCVHLTGRTGPYSTAESHKSDTHVESHRKVMGWPCSTDTAKP